MTCICNAYAVAVVVGVIACVLVAVCSACAGAICVDIIKRRIAACTYTWARCGDGVHNAGYRVEVGCKAS